MKEEYEFEEKKSFEFKTGTQEEQGEPAQFDVEEYEENYKFNNEPQFINEQIDVLKNGLKGQAESLDEKKERHERKKQENEIKKAKLELKRRMNDLKSTFKDSRLLHAPERSALSEGYSTTFKSKFTDRERAKKQNNKRSRLYQKRQNADMINVKAKDVMTSNYALLSHAMPEAYAEYKESDKNTLMDLAAFMETENVKSNFDILKLYIGNGEDRQEKDINKSMDMMLSKILGEDISDLRLDNDKVIADNAARLERLSSRVAAFDRLAEKNSYFEGLDEENKKEITEKLDKMRAIANYYTIRKEIINDPLYMKSYNDELSMDFTATDDPVKQELAKKLLKAYVVGEDMMAKNGAGDLLKKGRRPSFKNADEGSRFIREQEFILDRHHDVELLRESYVKTDVTAYMEPVLRKNKEENRKMSQTALDFVQGYAGEWYEQPEYADKGYDETKVRGYFEELDKIKVTDIKFTSYRCMIENIKDNYAICEKVDRLWFEIARALDHGYQDDGINDKKLIELRAKCNAIEKMKVTIDRVTAELVKNPESAAYTEEEWKGVFEEFENVGVKQRGVPFHVAYCGDPEKIMEEWMQDVVAEDATKEQSIKEAYPYVLGKDKNSVIPSEELERRKASYNRNALIQDYMFKDTIRDGISTMSFIKSSFTYDEIEKKYENETREERRKRLVTSSPRIISAMTEGKSADEVERLVTLYRGSPEEQLEFYKEVMEEFYSVPLSDFQLKEGGSILDNMHKKHRIGRIAANFNDVGKRIKELMEKNPEKNLKLPDRYDSIDEMIMDNEVSYSVGCALMSNHLQGYEQIPSTKWLHGFDIKDLGSVKSRAEYDLLGQYRDEAGNDPEDTLFSGVINRILYGVTFINQTHDFDPDGVYNLYTDIEDIYNKLLEKYDNEHF